MSMEYEKYQSKIKSVFKRAKKLYKCNKHNEFFTQLEGKQKEWCKVLIDNIENQKSVFAVIVTSLLKKIVDTKQDIRLHRTDMKNGYSGRSLDTKIITPWLKDNFYKFAPKESGWLTRSLEQSEPFSMKSFDKIRMRNKEVQTAFLSLLDDIEENNANPENYLITLFILLIIKQEQEDKISNSVVVSNESYLTIDIIIEMLFKHFVSENSSRLPVIAIYSIYQLLTKNVAIYNGKSLLPLKSHTSSDKRSKGLGDIEIVDLKSKEFFEVIEIKHNISIDIYLLKDVFEKIKKNISIKRYFVLTTAIPNFAVDDKEIYSFTRDVKAKYDIDIIPNGIIPTLKYYLRLIPDLKQFIEFYSENLSNEFKNSTDVREEHILLWKKIIDKKE